MDQGRRRSTEPSRESGRVWLLVVALSACGLLFVGMTLTNSFAATAHIFTDNHITKPSE